MKKKLNIRDVIHFYLSHYCDSVETSSGATMWSEMNDIRRYYYDFINGSKLFDIRLIIRMCIIGLYSNGHQKRLVKASVDKAVEKIYDTKIIKVGKNKLTLFEMIEKNKISICDFEELYEIIKQLIGGISGIGFVTVYDTARRIGHILKEPIYPEAYVYLHYNNVNFSARSVLKRKSLAYREPSILFCCEFRGLPSIIIEDILCTFDEVFVKIDSQANDADGTVLKSRNNNWENIDLKDFIKQQTDKYNNRQRPCRWPEFATNM